MSDEELEAAFEHQMLADYHEAIRACNYKAKIWLEMLGEHGARGAAKQLLKDTEAASGFTRLWECGRLDLTIEFRATRPQWSSLFTEEELAVARDRLQRLGVQNV